MVADKGDLILTVSYKSWCKHVILHIMKIWALVEVKVWFPKQKNLHPGVDGNQSFEQNQCFTLDHRSTTFDIS